jgi:hypothetical protein
MYISVCVFFLCISVFLFFSPLSFASRMCDRCGREVHLATFFFSFFLFFLLLWLLRASLSLAFVSVSEVGFYFIFRSFGLDDCRSIFLASFCDFVSVSEEGIPWSFWRK